MKRPTAINGGREPARKRQLRLRRADPALVADLRHRADSGSSHVAAPSAAVDPEEVARLQDAFLRARADLDNMRKRAQKEKEELRKFAIQDVVQEIVPAIDNFERALASKSQTKNIKVFSAGVEMIFKQLMGILEQRGVERFDPKGDPFDPQFHEAVQTLPAPSPDQEGYILETLQTGWKLNGRVVRPAMVVIAKAG